MNLTKKTRMENWGQLVYGLQWSQLSVYTWVSEVSSLLFFILAFYFLSVIFTKSPGHIDCCIRFLGHMKIFSQNFETSFLLFFYFLVDAAHLPLDALLDRHRFVLGQPGVGEGKIFGSLRKLFINLFVLFDLVELAQDSRPSSLIRAFLLQLAFEFDSIFCKRENSFIGLQLFREAQ